MKENQVLNALGALSQETRLRIVRHLIIAGDEGDTAGAIGQAVKASASKASFHLAALEQAGIIKSKRVSRCIVYRADFAQLGKLISYLLNDCCRNDPKVLACCDLKAAKECC